MSIAVRNRAKAYALFLFSAFEGIRNYLQKYILYFLNTEVKAMTIDDVFITSIILLTTLFFVSGAGAIYLVIKGYNAGKVIRLATLVYGGVNLENTHQ